MNIPVYQSQKEHLPMEGAINKWNSPLIQKYCPPPTNKDVINHPPHYIEGRKYEPIAVIEDWNLSYHLGNALKYISRAGRKDKSTYKQDLKKACWYLQRAIDQARN